jgi:hypothetical protein
MAFRLSTPLKNELVNESMVKKMAGTNGTAGTASLRIYTGTQPTSADDATSGTILCSILGIGWSSGTSGTAVFASSTGYYGTAVTSGVAGWARMETINATGTCRIDGDVGISQNNVFTINSASLVSGGVVTLLSADIYVS